MDIYNPVYPGLYYFDTFTFTTLGTSGHRGPDSTKTYANAPWREGDFSIVNGQQQWTVPATGTYRIEAAGAYGATPGRVVSGEVDLNEGQVVSLLVGQQPYPLTANVVDNVTVGGGGGTFVTVDQKPLIVASGGDGGACLNGYISRDTSVPNVVQPYVSMSGDGNRFASLDFDIITSSPQVSVYKYESNQWLFESSFSFNGFDVKMSGDGKTALNYSTSGSIRNIYVYYYDTEWSLQTILSAPATLSAGYCDIDINYDGSKIVNASSSGYIFYKTGKTWSSPVSFSSGWTGEVGVAISGDGNTLCMCSSGSDPPKVYDGSGNFIADLPSYGTDECPTNLSISYDGSVIAAHTTPLHAPNATGFVRVFVNRVFSYQITFDAADYSSKYIQLSYDGTKLLVGDNSYVRLYTDGTTYTSISTSTSPIDLVATSMNSSGSRIINAFVSLSAPQTFIYDLSAGGVPGAFVPSGTGNGVSGAGYLTDGQVSNPYFGFLKPHAYVDGGFGNMYWYGHKGEGGFGGGQSPLNLLTGLTSVTGYKQVRPSIPLLSGQTVGSIALSEDGNTFLITYIPYDHVGEGVNVYTYVDSSWVSSQLYDNSNDKPAVSMSVSGSVWLIGSNVWRNGSFEATLPGEIQYRPGNYYPQQIRTSVVSGNGSVCVVCGTVSCNVYAYSGGTWSVLHSFPHGQILFSVACALSTDGYTLVVMRNMGNAVYVTLYKYTGGNWSEQLIWYTPGNESSINTVSMNSDGSRIFIEGLYDAYEYSNNTLTRISVDVALTSVFSRTNVNLYAYANGNKVYAPEIPLDVTVNTNPSNFLLSMGSSILAVCDSVQTGNKSIVFVDMYNPTTTCTANTAVDHGYPHNYQIQITGTNSFDGTWDIVTTSSNTFTFQAFGGPTVTSGYVSGTTTGISGGGGYTGSAGDGVSGATCYADSAIRNLTDLGAASNTAGYVTVSLIDPAPLKQIWSWDSTQQWSLTNQIGVGMSTPAWSSSLGKFVSIGLFNKTFTSSDGVTWSSVQNNLELLYSDLYILLASTTGTLVAVTYTGAFRSIDDGVTWTLTLPLSLVLFDTHYAFFENNLFIIIDDNAFTHTSPDGLTWTTIIPNTASPKVIAYGKGVYVGVYGFLLYTSTNLTTWDIITDSNVYSPGIFWQTVSFDNGTFVAATNSGAGAYPVITSTNGFDWYGRSAPSGDWCFLIPGGGNFIAIDSTAENQMYSQDNGVTWTLSIGPRPPYIPFFEKFSGVYSPTLKYFLLKFNKVDTFYLALNGQFIVPSVSGGTEGNPLQLVWADTLGVIVAVTSYSILTSPDGINWTMVLNLKPDGSGVNDSGGVTVSWSRELGILMAYFCNSDNTNNSPLVYTSTDGITWTLKLLDQPFSFLPYATSHNPCKPCWSPQLGLFTIGQAISRDGINWVFGSGAKVLMCASWSPELKLFVGVDETLSYYSYDGVTWVQSNTSMDGLIHSIGWSPALKLFVGIGGYFYGSFFIYNSRDGKNWNLVYSEDVAISRGGWVVWSPELSLFVVQYQYQNSGNPIRVLTSTNGIIWTQLRPDAINALNKTITDIIWSPGLGTFTSSTSRDQQGMYNSATASKTF